MNHCSDEGEPSQKRLKKSKNSKKKSKKKRKTYSSSSDDSSTSSKSSSSCKDLKEVSVKHKSKNCKKKILKKKIKKQKRESKIHDSSTNSDADIIGPAVPNNLMDLSKKMAPETKEQWEKRQNIIKKVFDEQTGRYRLVKGDGEILEEIVSKDKHKEINKQATFGDGQYFQSKLPHPKMN